MSERTFFVLGKEGHPARYSVVSTFVGKGARKAAEAYANDRLGMYGADSAIVVGELAAEAPAHKTATTRAPRATSNSANTKTVVANTTTANTETANTAS